MSVSVCVCVSLLFPLFSLLGSL